MDLGTFPLVKNTPVFGFYFQSFKNSSFICVPAAPIPAFLIVPSVTERVQKPLGLFPIRKAPWRRAESNLAGSGQAQLWQWPSLKGAPCPGHCCLGLSKPSCGGGQYFALGLQPHGLRVMVFSSQLLPSPGKVWEEGLFMWPVCK